MMSIVSQTQPYAIYKSHTLVIPQIVFESTTTQTIITTDDVLKNFYKKSIMLIDNALRKTEKQFPKMFR